MSWSERARIAALALSSGEERQDDSVTAQLIRDIDASFSVLGDNRLKTADLLDELYKIEESPWGDWYGKPLSAHGLSRLLKPYRIKTMPVHVDGKTVRGYKIEQFSDAFAQFAFDGVRSVRTFSQSHAAPNAPNAPNASGREPLRIGEQGYLERMFASFEAGHIVESEWKQAERAHRVVLATSKEGT